MAGRFAIFDASPGEHKDDVLALARRNLPGLTPYRFEKRYERHPLGEPYLVLARDTESDRVVGMAGAFPTRLLVAGAPVRSAMPGDFAVDEEHRGFGPGLALQRRLMARLGEAGVEVVYGAPNRFAEAVLSRLEFTDVGRFTDYVRILKTEILAERLIAHRGAARAAARVSSAVLDPPLRLVGRERRARPAPGCAAEPAARFDERFTRLLEHAPAQHPVTGARDRELLDWRYEVDRPPEAGPRHRVFALFDASSQAVAYVAYRDEGNVRRVYDVLFEPSEAAVDALLAGFLRDAHAAGVAAVSVLYLGHAGLLTSRLRAFGFLARPGKTGVRVKVLAERSSGPSLEDPRSWYYLFGENDI